MTAAPFSAVMGILGQRLVQALMVALLVAGLCFLMVQSLPGDIAFRIAAGRYGYDYVTAEAVNAVRSELGLAGRRSPVSGTGWAPCCRGISAAPW